MRRRKRFKDKNSLVQGKITFPGERVVSREKMYAETGKTFCSLKNKVECGLERGEN
jgi:hypothetical protein